MLTQKAKYALRSLAVLAKADPRIPLPIHEIAERARAPQKFLEAILLELRRQGVLASTRGKAGGYTLAQPAAAIRVGEVIRMVDGPLAPIPCASLTAYRPCADCPDPGTCAIRAVMRRVRDATAAILDNTSIADIAGAPDADIPAIASPTDADIPAIAGATDADIPSIAGATDAVAARGEATSAAA